jgi:hypothetical protein
MLLSGALFVSGAVGMEMVGGGLAERGQQLTLLYDLITSIEEVLEMVGIAVFLFAIAD